MAIKKKSEPPTAKKSLNGKLVTKVSELKQLYEDTYRNRLQHRDMKPELSDMYKLKMELFDLRLKVCKNIRSEDWTEDDLIKVLKSLKKNKSADPSGLVYELFRPEIIGRDLLTSLVMFCNNVKSQLKFPNFCTLTKITSIYKSRGPKNDMDSDRGIFGVSKLRSIIEKLIYEDEYENIDDSMSDSNVGGRKGHNIRDNLFVVYAVINEALRKKKSVDIQFYDIAKCFDTMWTEETMNDYYDAGVQNYKFALTRLIYFAVITLYFIIG